MNCVTTWEVIRYNGSFSGLIKTYICKVRLIPLDKSQILVDNSSDLKIDTKLYGACTNQ